jgi:cytochrome c6
MRTRPLAAVLAAAVLAVALAACGSSGPGSTTPAPVTAATAPAGGTSTSAASSSVASQGKALFLSVGCQECHTLSDAGSTGQVGPDLDRVLPTEAKAARQIRNGGNGMPSFSDSLTPKQITAIATYVSSVAKGT